MPSNNPHTSRSVAVRYRNYRGEIAVRLIIPGHIFWGSNSYHPEPQWLMDCWDVNKSANRTFAVRDILAWDI